MNSNWLKQLAPDHAPPPPGWWPPAPGWWLALLLMLALAAVAIFIWRNVRRRRRRAALRELTRLQAAQLDAGATARGVENVMRRYALAQFGRDTLARISGDRWLAFVREQGATEMTDEVGRSLLAAAFGGRVDDDRERWFAAATQFVRVAAPARNRLVENQPRQIEAGRSIWGART